MVKRLFSLLLVLIINNAVAAARRETLDADRKRVPNGKFITTIPPPLQDVRSERSHLTTVPSKILPPTLPAQNPNKVPNGKFITTIPPPKFVRTEGAHLTTVPAKQPPLTSVPEKRPPLTTVSAKEAPLTTILTQDPLESAVPTKEPPLPGLPTTGPPFSVPVPVFTPEYDIVISTVSPVRAEGSEPNVIDIQPVISTNIIHYPSVTVEALGLVPDSNFMFLTVPPVIHQTTDAPEILPVLEPVTVEEPLGMVPDSNFIFLTVPPAIHQINEAPEISPVLEPVTAEEPLGMVPDSNFIFLTLPPAIHQTTETPAKASPSLTLPEPEPTTGRMPSEFVPNNNFEFLTLPPIPLVTAKATTPSEMFSLVETERIDAFIPNEIPMHITTHAVLNDNPNLSNLIEIQPNRPSTPRGPLLEALTVASTIRPPSSADANQALLRHAPSDILGSGNSTQTLPSSSTLISTTTQAIVSSSKSTENGIALHQMSSLLNQVLSGYNTLIRPRNDQARFVSVYSEFVSLSIIEFNTQKQRFSVMGYFKMNWRDDFLTWDPNSYEGTETVRMSTKSIWIPKLTIDKAYNGDGGVGEQNTDVALVHNKGYVQWFPEGTYSIVCQVNIEYYPFDDQICRLRYFIASEDNTTINLRHMETVDTSEYIENAEWKLVNLTFERKLENGVYYIDYVFRVKRRSGFAMFTLVIPVLLLSLLTGATFIIPVDSGEKLGFAVSTFLAYGIFDTIIIDTLPHNSINVSYFILYIVSLLIVSVFLTFYSILQAKVFIELCAKEHSIQSPTGQNGRFTWVSFLKKMDVVAFSFFSVVIIGLTSTFLAALTTKIDVL